MQEIIKLSSSEHLVYFIYDGKEYVKIRISTDQGLKQRLTTIQNGNPRKLFIYDVLHVDSRGRAQYIENKLHKGFEWARRNGEWFEAKPVIWWLEKVSRQRDFFIGNIKFRHTDEYFRQNQLPLPEEASPDNAGQESRLCL